MVEKLIVKNFGPIKEAEIDLKDVTVLIGPTGAGKSTLARFIAAQEELLIDLSEGNGKNVFRLKKYGISDTISLENIDFETVESERIIAPVYIPAERSFYSLVENISFILLEEKASIPQNIIHFGSLFQQARNALNGKKFETDLFGNNLSYSFQNGKNQLSQKEESFELKDSASGIQTTLPMLLVIQHLLQKADKKYLFIVEEPELNLYPEAQKNLIEFLVQNCAKNGHKLLITTHSPYTLTVLNNLIQADNVVKNHPELGERVKEIFAPDLWLDFDRVSAYFLKQDGISESILDKENRLIFAEKLDDISIELGEDFDKLLELEFSPEA